MSLALHLYLLGLHPGELLFLDSNYYHLHEIVFLKCLSHSSNVTGLFCVIFDLFIL